MENVAAACKQKTNADMFISKFTSGRRPSSGLCPTFLRADDDKVSVLAKNIIDKVAINQTLTKVRGTAELKKVICAMPSSAFLDFYAMSF